MVASLHGPSGPDVLSHAEEEAGSVLATAPIPRRQMVEQTAGNWVKLLKSKHVAYMGAQVSQRRTGQ